MTPSTELIVADLRDLAMFVGLNDKQGASLIRTAADRLEELERVVAAEREACAQVAEDAERRKWDTIRTGGKLEGFGAADIAAAIRKRGEG
jgi:hypothetical protein